MRTAMLTLLVFLWMTPSAAAQLPLPGGEPPPEPQPYGTNDPGGFRDILPPGTNGLANAFDLVAFQATGRRPPHNNDQLALYGDLVYQVPGLSRDDLNRHFKDATFGVKPEDVERRYSPRSDVTIVRDRQFGVPHVYGRTRGGTMFGLGYITAEDRLFFIDVLRHLGRAQLSSFVGGAEGNRELDREQWQIAPYTEADLERQLDQAPALYGDLGRLLREDLREYTAGINQYIREARIDPTKLPGEYFAISKPQGPEEWRDADAVAIASLVGGIFGKGGGGEMQNALDLERFEQRFGPRIGKRHFDYFRQADDPEAPRHVWNKRFPYLTVPKNPRGMAIPDRGSVRQHQISNDKAAGGGGQARAKRTSPGILGRRGGLQGAFPGSGSNALVVSGVESQSGRPLAVFGPQTGYFSPQILMEQDVHGPGIDARGAAFPGVNLYVELGRGRDFAWSATSAGNDIVDTFAVPLCEPGGARPTLESQHYEFRGRCEPFEVLERRNAWTPNAADQTPPGSETLRALRTKIGLVAYRGTVDGRPVAYTRLRTTYGHEVDSAVGFAKLNDPDAIRGPRDFQRAVSDIGYTFNWLYADSKQVAYFNSGNNPVRHPRHHPDFPVSAKLEWRGFDPDSNLARYTPFSQHPQLIDQRYISSWNGKQALGYRAADSRWNFSAVDRVQTLDKRIDAGLKGANKLDLVELTEAMEDGGTVDLRGQEVLPWALRVIEATRAPAGRARSRGEARRGTRRPPALTGKVTAAGSGTRLAPVPEMRDPRFRAAIQTLKQWVRLGAHRRDRDRSGSYEDGEAVALMDAWWPGLARATFDRKLGGPLYSTVRDHIGLGDMPHSHLGSAFDDGIWGHVQKDLRRALGRRVRLWPRSAYCGNGRFETCRRDLARSLAAIVPVDPRRIYRGDSRCENGDQVCWDEIRFTPLGGITQPPIHWVNRPTYQQVVEVQGRAPR